jgi:hypothetical protein
MDGRGGGVSSLMFEVGVRGHALEKDIVDCLSESLR